MNQTTVNIRNIMVAKDKSSDFIEERINNEILKDCSIQRILDSGNYYIYTFEIACPEQREELKKIEGDWI